MIGRSKKYLAPNWSVPENVSAFSTTRVGGGGAAPYDSFNLGLHVGDNAVVVQKNRRVLQRELDLPSEPVWLDQVHGAEVLYADHKTTPHLLKADAAWTDQSDCVLTVMTADCLPVLLASQTGHVIAVVHAGWRGLAAGIIQDTVASLPVDACNLHAWMGPAISVAHFEVGADVLQAFQRFDPGCESCFVPHISDTEKYYADIFALCKRSLLSAGVSHICGGEHCSYTDNRRFFSHRRDYGETGRMASLIWMR